MRKLAPLKVATIFLACLYDYGSRLVKVAAGYAGGTHRLGPP